MAEGEAGRRRAYFRKKLAGKEEGNAEWGSEISLGGICSNAKISRRQNGIAEAEFIAAPAFSGGGD